MTRVRLIFNSKADRGRAGLAAAEFHDLVRARGEVDWVSTASRKHATELAANAAAEGYAVVAALGGDGTVHEVINGLMQVEPARRPALAVIPVGSGNDFAFAAGIQRTPAEAIDTLFAGAFRPVDIGRIQDASGRSEYWMSSVGIGFDAAVAIESASITRVHGFLMYLMATLKTIALRFETPNLKVRWDGEAIERGIPMLTVGNGPREGGGFMTTPGALVDDGLLDFVYFDNVSRAMMLRFIPHVMRGTHGRFRQVSFGRTTRLEIESDRGLPIHIDGEIFARPETDVRQVTIEVVPGAIQLVQSSRAC